MSLEHALRHDLGVTSVAYRSCIICCLVGLPGTGTTKQWRYRLLSFCLYSAHPFLEALYFALHVLITTFTETTQWLGQKNSQNCPRPMIVFLFPMPQGNVKFNPAC